jgi:hypothetical protein
MKDLKYRFEGITALVLMGGGLCFGPNIFQSGSYPIDVAFGETHSLIIYFNSWVAASNPAFDMDYIPIFACVCCSICK